MSSPSGVLVCRTSNKFGLTPKLHAVYFVFIQRIADLDASTPAAR